MGVAGYVCLTFAYHMYGFHMGSLEVVFGNRTYFYLAGNMGNHWRKEKIIIESINYSTDNKVVTFYRETIIPYHYLFAKNVMNDNFLLLHFLKDTDYRYTW